jgi:hypothetical protein
MYTKYIVKVEKYKGKEKYLGEGPDVPRWLLRGVFCFEKVLYYLAPALFQQ